MIAKIGADRFYRDNLGRSRAEQGQAACQLIGEGEFAIVPLVGLRADGIGIYGNSLHFDTGPRRVWGPSYKRGSVPKWARR